VKGPLVRQVLRPLALPPSPPPPPVEENQLGVAVSAVAVDMGL
jgi:hypothetical protein